MAGTNSASPVSHFGHQVKKERLARGWSLEELSRRAGIAAGHLSRIENGKRPPTELIADACDHVFPERRQWFREYYEELRTWAPPGFRDWPEHEDRTLTIREWSPMVVTGMLQTENYARAVLTVHPGVTDDVVAARLASRMERQRRVLFRDDPPTASYLIDHAALYRLVGSPEIMAEQMAHLIDVASLPNVTMQVFPSVACPATQGGFLVADDAVFAETVVGGYVYTSEETSTWLGRLFDTLRAECYRASESAAIIKKAGETWSGERAATQAATAVTA
jgi:lambda repressor-like predicted transcriptional regulator